MVYSGVNEGLYSHCEGAFNENVNTVQVVCFDQDT